MAGQPNPNRSQGANEPTRPASGRTEAFWGQLTRQLDDWLRFEPDGTVFAFSGKVEIGTGTRTALAQIVAEELDVPFERVHMVMGDTELTPDEGYTAGSMTIQMSGSALRNASAEARLAMLEMAAEKLDADPVELAVKDGVISVVKDPERKITYGDLMGGKRFEREVTGEAPLKPPESYHIVGASVPRVDFLPKFTGMQSFIQDLRVPGMLHGRVVRPPSPGARLISLDESSVKDVPGLIKVVRKGSFVGVVAEREEQAVLAAERLKVDWQEAASLPGMDDLYTYLRSQPTEDKVLVEKGDAAAAFERTARQLHSEYYQPYHAHASIGPSCAIADVTADRITVWAPMPGPYPLRGALAQLAGMSPEKVHLVHVEGAGAYGQNGTDDACGDAVVLSQAVGKPVRVQWSRQDEFVWEPKAPAMVMEVRAGLDEHGEVIAWDYQVWSPSHTQRPRFARQLIAAQLISWEAAPRSGFFMGAERNAPTNYAFPNQRVTVHWLAESPLHASSFRSLGGAGNTFANESFIDECAAAAQVDALEYRLRYLKDPRAIEVLKAATDRANWERRPAPKREQKSLVEGRGLAFARYENTQAIVACVANVEVDTDTGAVTVKRLVAAHDCGLIINPDGLKNQIEGNLIQSLSRALKEEVKFEGARQTSVDWESYPILTFSEVPEVEVILINRPDQPAVGAGEPATITTAAAVANAIFDATGARVRQMPFTPARVKAAIQT